LNARLLNNTFLVGERVTLADIVVFCNLLHLYEYVLDPDFRAPFGCVTRWFTTILNQPQVKAVVSNFKLCTKAAVFDAKKFAEMQTKLGKKPAEKKEKAPAPPKAKKEKEVEAPEEMDMADEALALEPKSKDPFDALPKGIC
jgi:elongation factor 1-gamma